MINQAVSVVAPAVTNSVANDTPAKRTPVFSANASPSVNEELEAKFAEMEQPSAGKAAPGTPTEHGASAQGSPVQYTAKQRMTTLRQGTGNWDEEESERQDVEAAARAQREAAAAEGVSTTGEPTPGQK